MARGRKRKARGSEEGGGRDGGIREALGIGRGEGERRERDGACERGGRGAARLRHLAPLSERRRKEKENAPLPTCSFSCCSPASPVHLLAA
jgi:hypothetical protein